MPTVHRHPAPLPLPLAQVLFAGQPFTADSPFAGLHRIPSSDHFVLYLDDGTPAAHVSARRSVADINGTARPVALLTDLVVPPQHRGQQYVHGIREYVHSTLRTELDVEAALALCKESQVGDFKEGWQQVTVKYNLRRAGIALMILPLVDDGLVPVASIVLRSFPW